MHPKLPEHFRVVRQFNPDFPVFEVIDTRTGASVAIKFGSQKDTLQAENNEVFRQRLEAEAILLQRWARCANVVRLLATQLTRHRPFLVLELLGSSLDAELPEDGVSLSEALIVAVDVAVALADIHRLGDAHGDVTPNNILRHPLTDHWTLIDPGESALQTHAFSCEYLHGWERDIFMLGRVFMTLLTGKIDDEFDDHVRDWFTQQPAGDQLLRLVNRMTWAPRSRQKQPRGARPSAARVLADLRSAAKLNSVDLGE